MNNTILFIINTMSEGGAAKSVQFVLKIALAHFDQVSLLITRGDTNFPRLAGVTYHFVSDKPIKHHIFSIGIVLKMRSIIKKLKPGIIFPFISDVIVSAWFSTIGMNIKRIGSERGDPSSLNILWRNLISFIYPKFDFFVFQTQQVKNMFLKLPNEKSMVIENFYSGRIERPIPFSERNKTLSSAARFVPEKNLQMLITAFARVKKTQPELKLILIGDGPMKVKYMKHIKKLRLINDVIFTGYINNIHNYVSTSRIFVLTSKYEGIPNSLIEAIALGTPCISVDCPSGGPRSLIKNGISGFLIDANDIEDLITKINLLLNNDQKSMEYALRAQQILREINQDTILKKWNTFFALVLNHE